jgi:hemerythrin-like domain-containing protein
VATERSATARTRRAKGGVEAKVRARRAPRVTRVSRVQRLPAPTASRRARAPETLLALSREHEYIRSLLDALDEQAKKLRPGRIPDYALLYEMAHYLVAYPDEHHHAREELVYDRLAERDPDSAPLMREVQEEHRELTRRGRELVAELERVTRGGRDPDDRRIAYLCGQYTSTFRDHLHAEEHQVFRRATAKLRQEDWCAINADARHVDDPDLPARLAREYDRLANYLDERITRVGEDVAVGQRFGIESLIEIVAAVGGAMLRSSAIVRQHTNAALHDVNRAVRNGTGVLATSRAVHVALRKQIRAGRQELSEVIAGLRTETVDPISERMHALKRLVRADIE